jgi:transcriptional regulator
MYIPAHFRTTDLAWLDWLVARDAFGTLISLVDGAPSATHLPVLYQRDGNQVILTGHWAKPNPQWNAIEKQRVLFIFHGPHTYISPRWYAEPKLNVPTWNYATAHIYGRARVFHEPERLEKVVSALAGKYESGANAPWRLAESEGAKRRLSGIVGFDLVVDEIQLKFKLNQNHPEANVKGVIAALSVGAAADSIEIAKLMQDALQGKSRPQ